MNRISLFFCFCLLSLPRIFSAETVTETLIVERESWSIGISGLSDKGISGSSSYLLYSLPLLLYNEISDIEDHRLSDEEKNRFSDGLLKEKLKVLISEKSALHDKRDVLLFSEESRRERQKSYRELSAQIQEKEEEIIRFRERSREEVRVADTLPVEFRRLEGDEGKILDQPRARADRFMSREDLDFFITGSLEQIDDIYFFSLSAYYRDDEDPAYTFEQSAEEENLDKLVRDAGRELRSLILGRPWAGLSIAVNPSTALIAIDGISVGVGTVLKKDLVPGYATLTVSDNGYITENRQIYLAAEGMQEVSLALEAGEVNSLSLFSDPPGADVYFGALWMGETPLFTEFPEDNVQIKVSKAQYMPFFIPSDKLEGESVTVQLGSDLYEKELALKEAKSAFYRSLGWFSLSVGVPIVMAGIYQNLDNRYINYAYSYSQTGNSDYYDKALKYKRQADIAYMVYWGGFTLSGSLLVNVFFKLWNYIKAAEESTED